MDPKRKTSLQNKPSESIQTPANKADTTNKPLAKPPLKKGGSANQVKSSSSQNTSGLSTLSNKSAKSSTDKNEHSTKPSLTKVPSKATLKKDGSQKTLHAEDSSKETKSTVDKNEDTIKELLSVFSTFGQHISHPHNSNMEVSHELEEHFKELSDKIEKFINETIIPTIPSKADEFTSILKSVDNVFERLITERNAFPSPMNIINDASPSLVINLEEDKILSEIKSFTPEMEQPDVLTQKDSKELEQQKNLQDCPDFLVLKQNIIESMSHQEEYRNIQESLKQNYLKAFEQLESFKIDFPEKNALKTIRTIECSQDMGEFINKICLLQKDSENLRQSSALKDSKDFEESLTYVSEVCQDIRGTLEKEVFYKQSLNLLENKYFNYKSSKTVEESRQGEEDQTKKEDLVQENQLLKEELSSILKKLSKNSQDFLNLQPSSDDLSTLKSVQRVLKDSALLRMILNLDIRKQEKVSKENGSNEKDENQRKSFQLDEPPSCKKNLRFAEMSSIKKRQDTQSPFDLDSDTLKKEVERIKKENLLLVEQKSLLGQKVSETQLIRERLEQINTRLELQAGNLQQQNKGLKDKLKLMNEQAQEGEEGFKNLQEEVRNLKESEKEYQGKIEFLEQNLNEVTQTLNQLLAQRESESQESDNINSDEPKDSPQKESSIVEPQKKTFETILENISLVPLSQLSKKQATVEKVVEKSPVKAKENATEDKICNTASALGRFMGDGSDGYEFESPSTLSEDQILVKKFGEWRDQLKEQSISVTSVENIKQTIIQEIMKFVGQNVNKKENMSPNREEEQEKSPRLRLVDRFDQEIEQAGDVVDTYSEIISIRSKLAKAKEIQFILNKMKENGLESNNDFNDSVIIKLEDQIEDILKSFSATEFCKETEYAMFIDELEGEKLNIIHKLFLANQRNEKLHKQIDVLNSKINNFSGSLSKIKEGFSQTAPETANYINNEFSSDFVYRILHILTDQLLFAKEVLKLVDINKRPPLKNILEEVKTEISGYNKDVKFFYREHKSKSVKDQPLSQLKFISGLFNFYERNYAKLKKTQSKLIEHIKIEA